MADNETRVVYRAIADFTAVSRAAREAKREIKALRAEEAALNAQSAAGSRKNASAIDAETKSLQSHTSALQDDNKSVLAHAAAVAGSASSHRSQSAAASHANDVVGGMGASFNRAAAGANNAAAGSNRAAQAFRGGDREGNRLSRTMRGLVPHIERVNRGLDRLSKWRPHLTPPFIALVPAIAGVLALLNPLVASLGAVGGAAIGFAGSLGRVSGAALGAVPALFALLSVVGALKTAFGGVGGAFGAFKNMLGAKEKAGYSSAGGGGGSSAPKLAELTLTEKLTRAQDAYKRSIQDVKFASDDLNDARKDYIRRMQDLQRAVDNAGLSEMRAAANVQLAYENYKRTLADPNASQGDRMAAEVEYKEALEEQGQVTRDNKKNASDLATMKKKGMSGDRAIIDAQRALTDATYRQRDAQLELINVRRRDAAEAASAAGGVTALATATDAYEAALAKLSPSARSVVEQLVDMYDAWVNVRKIVQEAFFSKIVDDIGRLEGLLPSVQSLLTDAAGAMGDVAHNFLMLVTSKEWKKDLILLGEGNVPIIKNVGDGLLFLLDAFKDLTVAVQPFTTALSEGFKKGSENLRNMIEDARESGSLGRWLMGDKDSRGVLDTLRQWWDILKNIGRTLFNYTGAAKEFSYWLTDGLQAATEGWLKSSEEATKKGSPFKKWLEDIKPLLVEIKRMFGAFFGWFREQSMDTSNITQATEIFRKFTDELGPKLAKFFDSLADANVGTKFVDTIIKLVDMIDMIVNSGATVTFFDWLNGMLDIIIKIGKLPGGDKAIGAITSALAGLAAFTFVYNVTGLENLVRLLTSDRLFGLPSLLELIRRGFAKLRGVPFVPATPVVTGGAPGAAGKGGKSGKGGAVVTGAGGAAGFAGNLKLLEKAFQRTGAAKDLFIANLKILETQFKTMGIPMAGATGGGKGKKGKAGAVVAGAGKAGKKGKAGAVAAGAAAAAYVPKRAATSFVPAHAQTYVPKNAIQPRPGYGPKHSAATTKLPPQTPWPTAPAKQTSVFSKLTSALGKAGKPGGALGKLGSTLGKVVKGSTGLAGLAAMIGGGLIGDSMVSSAAEGSAGASKRVGGGMISGAANGAAWGGMIGSVVPGVGTAIGAGVGAVVGAGASLFSASEEDRDQFLADTGKMFSDFFTVKLPGFAKGAGSAIWGGLKSFGTWLSEQWTAAITWFQSLPSKVGGLGGGFWSQLQNLGGWLAEQWNNAVDWFKNFPYNVGVLVGSLWRNIMSLGSWLVEQWNSAVEWFTTLPARIAAAAGAVWSLIQDIGPWLALKWENFRKWAAGLPARVSAAAGDVWGKIKDIGPWLATKWETFRKWASGLPARVSAAASDVWGRMQGVGPWLSRMWTDISTWASGLPARVAAAAGDLFSGIKSGLSGSASDFLRGVRDGVTGKHNGGVIRRSGGGGVPGSGNSDTVPAMLTPKEFVLRREIVKRIGEDNLVKLNAGVMSYADLLRTAMTSTRGRSGNLMQAFGAGGLVPDIRSITTPNMPHTAGIAGRSGQAGYGKTIIVQQLIIQNPKPEPAGQSLHTTVRKLDYAYGGSS